MDAPFVWGPGGQQMTPEQIAAMQQQGSSMAPVGSTMEGLGRLAQAGAGAYLDYQQQDPAMSVANALANSGQPAYPGAGGMDQGFDPAMSQSSGLFGLLKGMF
jgi:hypothetical protein